MSSGGLGLRDNAERKRLGISKWLSFYYQAGKGMIGGAVRGVRVVIVMGWGGVSRLNPPLLITRGRGGRRGTRRRGKKLNRLKVVGGGEGEMHEGGGGTGGAGRRREEMGHSGWERGVVSRPEDPPFTHQALVGGGWRGVGVGVSVPTPPVAAAPNLTISLSSP